MTQYIYLISGKIYTGKTTLAQYLVNTYPNEYVELTLAKLLKVITFKLLKHFNVPIDSVEDLDDRVKKETYRFHMQHIATECFRDTFGQDFWCQQLEPLVREQLASGKNVIISDVRFPNEQQYFKTHFKDYLVRCVMLKRPCADSVPTTHSSEDTTKLSVDIEIDNNGTLEEFYNNINGAFITDVMNTSNSSADLSDSLVDIEEPNEVEVCERACNIVEKEMDSIISAPDVVEKNTLEHANNAPTLIANDSSFNNLMHQNNNKNSSIGLGEIGEAYVLELIRKIRPKNDTYDTSSNAHVADLHSIDYTHNIHWVIEVKNKDNLTKNDIDKFRDDIKNVSDANIKQNTKVIGLFLSIRSISIPRIGDVYVSRNEIYLSKNYFTPEILEIVFSFVEQYKECFNITQTKETTATEYVLSPKLISLFALLNTEYQRINNEVRLLAEMKDHAKQDLANIEELTLNAQLRQRLIYLLNEQVKQFEPIISSSTYDEQYNQFIDELRNAKSKDKVQKGITLKHYPELSDQINKLSWKTFLDQSWALAQNTSDDLNDGTNNSGNNDTSNNVNTNASSLCEEYVEHIRAKLKTEEQLQQFNQYLSDVKNNNKITRAQFMKNYPSITLFKSHSLNFTEFKKMTIEYAKTHSI